jgi:FkbM family methyltransferase
MIVVFFVSVAAELWVTCALEPDFCSITNATTVRFGADTRWEYLVVEPPGIKCNIASFNRDPAVSTAKACQIEALPTGPPTPLPTERKIVWACSDYSQYGESATISRLFFDTENPLVEGTFLEVGALDGQKFSNSLFFESCLNWTGVLVEANPTNYNLLRRNRRRTHNLHMAVCEQETTTPFIPNAGTNPVSTLHSTKGYMRKWHGTHRPRTIDVYCGPLSTQMCLLGIPRIDFMSVDVGGAELQVVKSFDWQAVHVYVVIVDADEHDPSKNAAVREHMLRQGFTSLPGLVEHSDLFVNTQNRPRTRLNNVALPCALPVRLDAPPAPLHVMHHEVGGNSDSSLLARSEGIIEADLVALATLAIPMRAPFLRPVWVGSRPRFKVYNWPWSIPDTNFLELDFTRKDTAFASIVPGDSQTYTYSRNEKAYHEGYARSLYAITMRKAGWETMRHYEIIADGCVPYFVDIDYLPPNTMSLFPRELVRALMNLPGVEVDWSVDERRDRSNAIIHRTALMPTLFPARTYEVLARSLNDYARRYMSSTAVFRAAVEVAGLQDVKSVLFIRNSTIARDGGTRADYHEMLAIIGVKLQLGVKAVVFPDIPFLYDDYPLEKECGWGNCFSYGRRIDSKLRAPANATPLAHMVAEKQFDVIIYGEQNSNRLQQLLFSREIADAEYEPNRIWLLRGADSFARMDDPYPPGSVTNDELGREFSLLGRAVFHREL